MNLKVLAAGLLLAAPALLQAQTVTYSLPQTTVTVEVDAVQESFFAGPYAAYAKRFLGIDPGRNHETVLQASGGRYPGPARNLSLEP